MDMCWPLPAKPGKINPSEFLPYPEILASHFDGRLVRRPILYFPAIRLPSNAAFQRRGLWFAFADGEAPYIVHHSTGLACHSPFWPELTGSQSLPAQPILAVAEAVPCDLFIRLPVARRSYQAEIFPGRILPQ